MSCALQIASLIAGLEGGARPAPVFFSGPNCDTTQYPVPGDQILPSFFNGHPYNFRNLACRDNMGGLGASVRETIEQRSMAIDSCPLPAIRSMIIPDGIRVTFYAPELKEVDDPGIFILSTKNKETVRGNVVHISTSFNSPLRWGTSTNPKQRPGHKDCRDTGKDIRLGLYSDKGKMMQSLISCGMPFWPSLTSVLLTGDNKNPYVKSADGKRFIKGIAGVRRDQGYTAYCKTPFDRHRNSGCASMNVLYENDASCGGSGDGFSYSTGDCIADYDTALYARKKFGINMTHDEINALAPCAGNSRGIGTDDEQCFCGTDLAVNGSVEKISFEFINSTWELQQFRYCTGEDTLTLGDIKIKRYGLGTPACDIIVPEMCANTAFAITYLLNPKACACINEQIRIRIQFAGVNMPVQCFSSICSTTEPGIYRTAEQLQGCSARMCRQIIFLHGSQIAAEGWQNLLCNGQVYSLDNPIPSFPTEADDGSSKSPSSSDAVVLGPEFYIALGLLMLMIMLLIIFFIRGYVTSRRAKRAENAEILSSLERVVRLR